jgi:nicotinamide-nucleotide amidase
MHDAEIILVGDELLKGERADSHLAYLARALARYGVRVGGAYVVGDAADSIAEVVRARLGLTRVLVVTGGLGPTPDDVTRLGVAKALGRELEFHEDSWRRIVAFFERIGREATDANRSQATFPEGAEVIGNDGGTAPGFVAKARGTTTFVLPGPPHELRRMFEAAVAPRVEAAFSRPPLRVETLRTIGVGESQLMVYFGAMLDGLAAYTVSSLPWISGVDIVLTARRDAGGGVLEAEAREVVEAMSRRLGPRFYERGERSLAEVTGSTLARRAETVAVAESLTAGLVSKLLTDAPGSSAYFLAGAAVYSNHSKTALVGVDPAAIESRGAVSEDVCARMAEGVRTRCNATWGLSTTGIAGPAGGSEEKPVGLTYMGLSSQRELRVERRTYFGGRDAVRQRAAYGAIWMLYEHLSTAEAG